MDIADATDINLTAGTNLFVDGSGQTLSDFDVSVDPTSGGMISLTDFAGTTVSMITVGGTLIVNNYDFTNGENISLTAPAGGMVIDSVSTTGGGSIDLSAATGIDETADDDAINISTSGPVVLNVTGGGDIGASGGTNVAASDRLDINAGSVEAHVAGGAGGIFLKNTGAGMTLADLDTTNGGIEAVAGGAIDAQDVQASSPVTLIATAGDIDVDTVSASAGDTVTIDAQAGAIDDPDANSMITTSGQVVLNAATSIGATNTINTNGIGSLAVIAADSVDITGNSALTDLTLTLDPSGAATYDLTGFTGLTETITTDATDLTITNLDSTNGTNLDVTVTTGDVNVDSLDTTGTGTIDLTTSAGAINIGDGGIVAGSGAVTLNSNTTVDESAANDTVNITTSGPLTIDAGGAVGATGGAGIANTGPLDVQVGSLDTSVTGAGGLFIKDTGGVTLADLDTANGGIEVRSTAGIDAQDVQASSPVTIIADTGDLEVDTISASGGDAITLTATAGSIVDNDTNSSVTSATGLADLNASGTIGAGGAPINTTVATLDISAGGDVVVNETDAVELTGVNITGGGGLDLDAGGAISDAAGTTIAVAGNAALADAGGAGITLGDNVGDTTDFGTLTFNSTGAVSIAEDSATELSGASSAGSVTLDSGGALTNAASASLAVTGNAGLTGTSITLGDQAGDTMNFGSLTLNSGGTAEVEEDSATVLSGTGTVNALILSSTGSITDDGTANLTVTNNAALSGTSITLDDTYDFGPLSFTSGGAVLINDNSATVLSGTSSANSLDLTSSGSITDDGTANLTVTNNAALTGTSITLDDTYAFGSLTFTSGGAVAITEADATELSGASTADSLDLNSGGALTDAGGASLGVTNNATLTGTSITLDGTNDFGSLTFNSAGAVAISENSNTVLSGTSTADTLNLTSNGSIADDGTADVTVTGLAEFADAGGAGITLDDTYNFGTLRFTSTGPVTIAENSNTVLAGTSTAGSLNLDSASSISNNAGASLTVTNNADFADAGGAGITLGTQAGDTMNFGSLTFTSTGTVTVEEDSAMELAGSSAADTLTLTSIGAMTDAGGSDTTVTGATVLTAGAGNDITLDEAGNDFDTVQVVSGDNVSIQDTNALVVAGITATSEVTLQTGAALTQTAGITGTGLELLGAGPATLDGANDVDTLAGNVTGDVIYNDTDDIAVGTVNTVGLTSGGSIDLDAGGPFTGTDRTVAGGAGTTLTIDAVGITLGAGGAGTETVTNTGTGTATLTATGAGDISLANNSVGVGEGLLTLTAAGNAIDAAATDAGAEINADGDVTMSAGVLGGGNRIDLDGDGSADSTFTVNANAVAGGQDVDLAVLDQQFSQTDITSDRTDSNVDITLDDEGNLVDINGGTPQVVASVDTTNGAVQPVLTFTQTGTGGAAGTVQIQAGTTDLGADATFTNADDIEVGDGVPQDDAFTFNAGNIDLTLEAGTDGTGAITDNLGVININGQANATVELIAPDGVPRAAK